MSASASPLLDESLALLKESGITPGPVVGGGDATTTPLIINQKDTLLVIDMQFDFLPGGSFGVAEGNQTIGPICDLIGKFQAVGAKVLASRDYHSVDHCSFNTNGGPFPPHCVQGTKGCEFHPDIAAALAKGITTEGGWSTSSTQVIYKGLSKDVESFGAFEYPTLEGDRLSKNTNGSHCDSCWTGSYVLQCSNLKESPNAPPDVMAIFNKKSVTEVLGNPKDQGEGRIFVVGLALDFCVLDTALNASAAGYKNIQIVADCTRSAHIPGFGKFGTGFLSDPTQVSAKLKGASVSLTTSNDLKF